MVKKQQKNLKDPKNKQTNKNLIKTQKTNKLLKKTNTDNSEKETDNQRIINLLITENKQLFQEDINYDIDSWTSFTHSFHPKNIKIDTKEGGLLSKWSVKFKSQNEYVVLKLEKDALISTIIFGKFHDPTNLKEFKVEIGQDRDQMIEVLHSSLDNYDNEYEAFQLDTNNQKQFFPCRYVKIIPLMPYNESYNMSVWYIKLKGTTNSFILDYFHKEHQRKQNLEEQRRWISQSKRYLKGAYEKLMKVKEFSKLVRKLENPTKTKLYHYVMNGKFNDCLKLIEKCFENDKFSVFQSNSKYSLVWRKMDLIDIELNDCFNIFECDLKLKNNFLNNSNNKNKENKEQSFNINDLLMEINEEEAAAENDENIENISVSEFSNLIREIPSIKSVSNLSILINDDTDLPLHPSKRGGHCMVLDDLAQKIYCFGGWNTKNDLNDFWVFDILKEKWSLISSNVALQGGPSPRSCHSMVFDRKYQRILIFGKYSKDSDQLDSHLYEYDTRNQLWKTHLINRIKHKNEFFTGNIGQVYDGQICLDWRNQILYLFGGIRVGDNVNPSGTNLFNF